MLMLAARRNGTVSLGGVKRGERVVGGRTGVYGR